MAILANFPLVSQRTSITSDGKASENASFDCVPASIGAAILWYENKRQWDTSINPDMLKDAAYNEAYTGGTGAAAYVAICQKLGYKLYPVNNATVTLAIQKAHEFIRQGLPVVFTQQDDYSSNSNYSHVCVFFAEGTNNLTCLDPYIAQPLQFTDAQWIARLRSSQLWVVQPINSMELSMLNLSDPMGRYFVQAGPNTWHCTQTNASIHDAHLDFYRKYEGVFGLPLTGEVYLEAIHGTAIMIYERAIAIYDPNRIVPNQAPPGAGAVYLLRVDEGVAQQIVAKPLVLALNSQITSLKAELATKGDTAPLQARIDALEAAIKQVSSAIAPVVA